MKPGIRPGTEKRTEFLKYCTEIGIPASKLAEMTEVMRGKTDPEKERIAEALLQELREKGWD